MKNTLKFAWIISLVLLNGFSNVGNAAAFFGRVVLPNGQAAPGVMVSVADTLKKQRQTVYTNAAGEYTLVTPFAGKLEMRARLANFADATRSIEKRLGDKSQVDFKLLPFAGVDSASEALAASAHNAGLAWQNPADKQVFISQCNYCHQMGNATTRAPRSHDGWLTTLSKMEATLAMLTQAEKQRFAKVLQQGFDGKPVAAEHFYGANETLSRAKVEEWQLGDAFSFIHDMDVASNGRFYGTDEGHDILWELDPATGKVTQHVLPESSLPRGGVFSGMNLPIGVFTGKHGPHSLAQTSDGRIWITNALSSTLMSFEPNTRKFETYPVPGDALYPHTIRVDQADIVWFTIVASNQIGRFDPKSKEMKVIRLPHNTPYIWLTDMLFPTLLRISSWLPESAALLHFTHHRFLGYNVAAFPYGIDINPRDGSVWYAKLYANKIGRIDPNTLAITEYDTPLKGPRRPRFDQQGIFWIPAFDESALMRFDPQSAQFKTYKIPGIAAGEYETPYALNVDKNNGMVWLSANNSDRIVRFNPADESFQSYPSPTRVTVLRDFSFTRDGKVCSSQSNLPSYAIEGGTPSFICIDPQGGARDQDLMKKIR